MLANIRLLFNPGEQHLSQIESWLKAEYKKTKHGFFCNWDIIQNAFNAQRLLALLIDDHAMGFAIWYEFEHTATIQIVEISPPLRGNKYGKLMIKKLFDYFMQKDIWAIQLNCKPSSSEVIWKALGFCEFPDVNAFKKFNIEYDKFLYKILHPDTTPLGSKTDNESIELWDDEPIYCGDMSSKWIWEISYLKDSDKVIRPIIHPAHCDWKIRWKKGNKIISEGKVKYFGNDISFQNFIILREMPV